METTILYSPKGPSTNSSYTYPKPVTQNDACCALEAPLRELGSCAGVGLHFDYDLEHAPTKCSHWNFRVSGQ